MKTTIVQRRISPLATRLCAKLGFVDRRHVAEGIRLMAQNTCKEGELHLWMSLAASSPLITPKTLLSRVFKPKIILPDAAEVNLSEIQHYHLSKTITTRRLLRAANKFSGYSGRDYFKDIVLPIVEGKVAEFNFSGMQDNWEERVVDYQEILEGRKEQIFKGIWEEETLNQAWKGKVIDQAFEFARKYSGLEPREILYRFQKLADVGGNPQTVVASFFMHMDPLELVELFEKIEDDPLFKELYAYGDSIRGIISAFQHLKSEFKFDRAKLQTDDKYIYRKMCELVRGAQTGEALLLFFMDQLFYAREVAKESDGVFDAIRFIYAPLAERLRLVYLADDFRDQYLRLHPDLPGKYEAVVEKVRERIGMNYETAKMFLQMYSEQILELLEARGININNITIKFRVKSPFSIWEKVEKRPNEDHTYENLRDILGVKIICRSSQSVQEGLSPEAEVSKIIFMLTKDELFKADKKDIKECLDGGEGWQGAKAAGITAFCYPVVPLELQVMTDEMNKHNKHGLAAHWHYNIEKQLMAEAEEVSVEKIVQLFPKREPEAEMSANYYLNFNKIKDYWSQDPSRISGAS